MAIGYAASSLRLVDIYLLFLLAKNDRQWAEGMLSLLPIRVNSKQLGFSAIDLAYWNSLLRTFMHRLRMPCRLGSACGRVVGASENAREPYEG